MLFVKITILLFILILGIIIIQKYNCSPVFGIGGDGWYNASPNGLSSTTPRIRMQFSMNTNAASSPSSYTLFSINRALPGYFIYSLGVNKRNNQLFLVRYDGSNKHKEFSIDTNMQLNDGNWHSIDVSISTVANTIDIIIDGKVLPRVTDSENIPGELKPSVVYIGGLVNGNSFQGKIKDIWFDNVKKTDISYQYENMRGENGGIIS